MCCLPVLATQPTVFDAAYAPQVGAASVEFLRVPWDAHAELVYSGRPLHSMANRAQLHARCASGRGHTVHGNSVFRVFHATFRVGRLDDLLRV